MSTSRLLAAALVASAVAAAPADAQGWLDRAKKKAQDKIERRVDQRTDQAIDKGIDKGEAAVRCAATDKACIDAAQQAGKQVVVEGNADATAGGASAAATGGAAAGAARTTAFVNYDFVPGTRPLMVEDLSRDNVGDFPRRLEFKDGNMEVAEWRGGRYLRATAWPSTFAIPLPEVLPERFTLEFDATPGVGHNFITMKFAEKAKDDVRFRTISGRGEGGVFGPEHQSLGRTPFQITDGTVSRIRVMADGKYVKVYINEARVANIPNADIGRSNKIVIEMPAKEDEPVFLANFSVMAGGRKLYDALASSGRVATQGILFATGSDEIRPESKPTLDEMAGMLKEHAELKLTIEGHTDNAGQAAANQTLSERRAAAVKQALVSRYGIDEARLTAKGFGAAKPAASNDTPEGRQQNRRVELVRM